MRISIDKKKAVLLFAMSKGNNYKKAVELGKADLKNRNPEQTAEDSGADFIQYSHAAATLTVRFLNREVDITWPDFNISFAGSKEEVPVELKVLLLHYLRGASGSRITGEWISFQEVPDGRFYSDAFLRRARNPMVQFFGNQPDLLVKLAAGTLGARPFDHGDLSVVFNAFPMVPVALILWKGDDEFPPDGNILFDGSISQIFSAEDIAVLTGMIIYSLIGMAKKV